MFLQLKHTKTNLPLSIIKYVSCLHLHVLETEARLDMPIGERWLKVMVAHLVGTVK